MLCSLFSSANTHDQTSSVMYSLVGLCDGRRDLGQIQACLDMDADNFSSLFGATYSTLNGLNLMLLRF